jgi:excisionase family DNA binding protein
MSKIRDDSVLTTDEAMKYLKISKPTLLKCVRIGKINAAKVGREWRFLQSELYQFLKGTKG